MLHRVVRVAAGFGPIGVDDRRRQRDGYLGEIRVRLKLAIETEHGDPLSAQRLLFAVKPVARCEQQTEQQKRGRGGSYHPGLNMG
jgi:hypothetical protein